MKLITKLVFLSLFFILSGLVWAKQPRFSSESLPENNVFVGDSQRALYLSTRSTSGKSSARKITSIIRNGKNSMPAFGKKLSRAEIAFLAAYVRGV